MKDNQESPPAGEALRLQPANTSPQPAAIDGAYDPHEHRDLPHGTNNCETLIHMLKCSFGTGILAMPQAFSKAGFIPGIVGTVVAGMFITHALRILIRAQYFVCKQKRVPLVTYPEAVRVSLRLGPRLLHRLAAPAAGTVDFFIVTYQLGVCCVYIVFIAVTNKKVADPIQVISLTYHMLFILVPMVAINMIPNLKVLAPFSLLANVLTFVGLSIVMYYMIDQTPLSPTAITMSGNIANFPLFFGTVLFALTAVGVVVSLENNMKTPKSFGSPCGVLNIGMSIVVVVYAVFGALGYKYCVTKCEDSITLNLPNSGLSTAVLVLYMIAIFISYGLQCYVPVEILWRDYLKPRLVRRGSQRLCFWEYLMRFVICMLTWLLALLVPRLGLFISLFGALCLSALGLAFPALMDLCCVWPNRRCVIIKDVLLFIVGILSLIFGTFYAIKGIVVSFE